MRLVFLVLLALVGAPVVAESDPVLIERSVAELAPREVVIPMAWAAAIAGTGSAVALSVWAWDKVPSPDSFAAFCWATLAMAVAAVALEVATEAPEAPPK